MSTCLSLMHGYIFLLYVYLLNKDACWEIHHVFYITYLTEIKHFKIPEMSRLPRLIVTTHLDFLYSSVKPRVSFIELSCFLLSWQNFNNGLQDNFNLFLVAKVSASLEAEVSWGSVKGFCIGFIIFFFLLVLSLLDLSFTIAQLLLFV